MQPIHLNFKNAGAQQGHIFGLRWRGAGADMCQSKINENLHGREIDTEWSGVC